MNNKKVSIIGTGLGGLSSGLLLSKKSYDVSIFEKEKFIGGRATSLDGNTLSLKEYRNILFSYNMAVPFSYPSLEEIFNKDMLKGYKLDLGFHSIEGGTMSDLGRISRLAGYNKKMLGTRLALITEDGYDYPIVKFKDKIRFLPSILRLIFSNEKTMEELDLVSIAQTIEKYGKGKMRLILELLPRVSTTVNDLTKISAGESFRASQSNLRRGSTPVGYPIGGLGAINNVLAEEIKKNNGKIFLENEVNEILIENNKAFGIKTKEKEYYSDIIIYNGLVQNFFNIADEKHFTKEYIKYLKSLKGTGSLCAYYSFNNFDTDLIGKSFIFIERDVGVSGNDAVGMIEFVTALPEANISPKGTFVVQSYIICSPEEAKSNQILIKLKEILDKYLNILIPEYKKQLNWAIYPLIWHLDGVAKTIDNEKPNIDTPIKNLYFVGDCVKAPGIGINCAINSAKKLVDMI